MGLSRICLLSLLAAVLVPQQAPADDVAQRYFSDTILLDQNGRPQRFYSDLLRGKTVVIHSFFASCHGVCPVLLGRMKAIQERLGARGGRDVVLLSITVNAGDDTPAKMLELAASLGAKPGWFFLSGKKANTDWILSRLGQYVDAKEDHSSVLLIGNETTGVWTKVQASTNAEEVIRVIDKVSFPDSK